MANRTLRHLVLEGIASSKDYTGRGGGHSSRPSPVADRRVHAEHLIAAIDAIEVEPTASATYIEVVGRPGEPFLPEKFDVSGLSLLSTIDAQPSQRKPGRAVVRAGVASDGLQKLKRKLEDFRDKDRSPDNNGLTRPHNADLANSINEIIRADLQKLWRHPTKPFPTTANRLPWEVWLEPDQTDAFIAMALDQGMTVYQDKLTFPEDTVVLVVGDTNQMARSAFHTGAVRAVSPLGKQIGFVNDLNAEEQAEWVGDLLQRTQYNQAIGGEVSYVTLLDTGVSLSNPLIQPALAGQDRHAAVPGWDITDNHGHGTQMAGLALFGDLRSPLSDTSAVSIVHRLESSKVIPDGANNPHHLLGDRTQKAINAVEVEPSRIRTFVLASTTGDDTPHSGAPTSWSSEIDQLAAGVSGEVRQRRLILTSVGNILAQHGGAADYLATCDSDQAEIESPAQAWNAIAVGAMTKMDGQGGDTYGDTIAEVGDLAPMSRTASWKKVWPIKPDVVLEGGNWYNDGMGTPNAHPDLMLVTTSRNRHMRLLTHMSETSAATALASRELALLRSKYPDLWPETIRALYVASARWTEQMWSHIPMHERQRRGALDVLFRRYGFGCPDINRALASAENAVTIIAQDEITPYTAGAKNQKMNEMKLFELPWPVGGLSGLENANVTLRIALSTFIEPNPSEVARGRKNRYASHGLRFELKGPDEDIEKFTRRVGLAMADANLSGNIPDSGEWQFGFNRRSVGSLHIDALSMPASDLARRGVLAVYPVGGWWKDRRNVEREDRIARFALVIEIDAEAIDVNLYTEVQQAIAARAEIQT